MRGLGGEVLVLVVLVLVLVLVVVVVVVGWSVGRRGSAVLSSLRGTFAGRRSHHVT